MSRAEIKELSALGEWLSSFPQLEQFAFDKENSSIFDNDGHYDSNQKLKRYGFSKICTLFIVLLCLYAI